MPPDPTVSVIVVAYHGGRWIGPCIRSLLESIQRSQVQAELIVVDNGGTTPGLEEWGRWSNRVRIVPTPRVMGFADANNFALRYVAAASQAIGFVNQDTLSGKVWLQACVAALQADRKLGAVVPLIYTYDWSHWDQEFCNCASAADGLVPAMQRGATLRPVYRVPVVPAAAMLVRTSVLRRVGPFDPVFGSYYEDYDLCRRIRAAGFEIGIVSSARVAHFGGSATCTPTERRRRGRQIVRNRVLHELRLAGVNRALALLRYLSLTFPRNLARSMLHRSAHPPMEFLAGHLDLLPLTPRLLSERFDLACWRRDLAQVGLDWGCGRPKQQSNCAPSVFHSAP